MTFFAVLVGLALYLGSSILLARLFIRAADACTGAGRWRLARALSWTIALLPLSRARQTSRFLRSQIAICSGDPLAVIRDARANPTTASEANELINALIAAGRYREALAVPNGIRDVPMASLHLATRTNRVLLDVNRAEADYNLGLWGEAEARLQAIDDEWVLMPVATAGLRVQWAWICAHTGRPDDANAYLAEVRVDQLPRTYQAELHFARCVSALAAGELARAESALADARNTLVRVSSHRNALFLAARICVLRGDLEGAERWCRAGAEHPYRFQGGDGLLLWGDTLAELGRRDDSVAAWQRAISQDPESESASKAAERLGLKAALVRTGAAAS